MLFQKRNSSMNYETILISYVRGTLKLTYSVNNTNSIKSGKDKYPAEIEIENNEIFIKKRQQIYEKIF